MKLHEVYGIMGVKIPEPIATEEKLLMAIQEFQRLNTDEKMRLRMADREKEATDLAIIKGAVRKKALEEGEKLGLEKGEKLGLEKGEKLGLEKAEIIAREKAEKDRMALALKMLDKGYPIDEIAELTGYSQEEINNLRGGNNS